MYKPVKEREYIPDVPSSFMNLGKVNKHIIKTNQLKPIGNLTCEQENEYMFSNSYKTKLHKSSSQPQINRNKSFHYNNLIHINKKKLMVYFLNQKYSKIFALFQIYLTNLFNGKHKEDIKELYDKHLINDSVYLYTMKCYELIDNNIKCYVYSKAKNIDNCLDTTENYFYIKQLNNNSVKEDLFMLLAKFQLLLLMIDKKVFKKEIENVSNLYKVFYSK
jgi:hypothetical protein